MISVFPGSFVWSMITTLSPFSSTSTVSYSNILLFMYDISFPLSPCVSDQIPAATGSFLNYDCRVPFRLSCTSSTDAAIHTSTARKDTVLSVLRLMRFLFFFSILSFFFSIFFSSRELFNTCAIFHSISNTRPHLPVTYLYYTDILARCNYMASIESINFSNCLRSVRHTKTIRYISYKKDKKTAGKTVYFVIKISTPAAICII